VKILIPGIYYSKSFNIYNLQPRTEVDWIINDVFKDLKAKKILLYIGNNFEKYSSAIAKHFGAGNI